MQQSARSHAKVTTPVRNVQNDPCRVAMAAWHLPWPCSEAWPPVAELRDAPTSGGTGEPQAPNLHDRQPSPWIVVAVVDDARSATLDAHLWLEMIKAFGRAKKSAGALRCSGSCRQQFGPYGVILLYIQESVFSDTEPAGMSCGRL